MLSDLEFCLKNLELLKLWDKGTLTAKILDQEIVRITKLIKELKESQNETA